MTVDWHAVLDSVTLIESVAVFAGLFYLILVVFESIWCWFFSLISVTLYFLIFAENQLWAEVVLQVYYFGTTVYGFYKWKYGGDNDNNPAPIMRAGVRRNLIFGGIILTGTVGGGFLLDYFALELFPYLDSFTTVGALVTTWMVTQKYLENWLYWIVVNTAGVVLMYKSELYLTALLFLVYLIIVVFGFLNWIKLYRGQKAAKEKL